MSPARRIPEALLERYLSGELSAEARADVEAKLAASPDERARLDALRADSAAYLLQHPPAAELAKLKLETPPRRRWWLWLAPVAAAAAAALVVVLVQPPPPEPGFQVKGELVLAVFRERAGVVEPLAPGAAVAPGDRVRFEVRAPADGWVAVLSRDGAGHVSVYYPHGAEQAAGYTASAALLPGAIALDDTRGPEQVWAVHSASPFPLDAVVKALEEGAAPAGPGLTAARFDWVKP